MSKRIPTVEECKAYMKTQIDNLYLDHSPPGNIENSGEEDMLAAVHKYRRTRKYIPEVTLSGNEQLYVHQVNGNVTSVTHVPNTSISPIKQEENNAKTPESDIKQKSNEPHISEKRDEPIDMKKLAALHSSLSAITERYSQPSPVVVNEQPFVGTLNASPGARISFSRHYNSGGGIYIGGKRFEYIEKSPQVEEIPEIEEPSHVEEIATDAPGKYAIWDEIFIRKRSDGIHRIKCYENHGEYICPNPYDNHLASKCDDLFEKGYYTGFKIIKLSNEDFSNPDFWHN